MCPLLLKLLLALPCLFLWKQDQDREAKVVSDQAARETAQFKTESALNGVAKVQDRLICALQTELDITNRAREAAQVCVGERSAHGQGGAVGSCFPHNELCEGSAGERNGLVLCTALELDVQLNLF